MSEAPDLMPCPFCGEDLIQTESLGGYTHNRRVKHAKECFIGWVVVRPSNYADWNVRADLARPVTVAEAITVEEAAQIAKRIERHGVDHDRAMSGWGVPDNCIVVFEAGNIISYVPTKARALSHEGGE